MSSYFILVPPGRRPYLFYTDRNYLHQLQFDRDPRQIVEISNVSLDQVSNYCIDLNYQNQTLCYVSKKNI